MVGVGILMKAKKDSTLLFLVLILGGIAFLCEQTGQIPLAAAAVVIICLVLFSRMLQRKKQREARDQLARMIFRNQIPLEEEKKLNTKLAQKNPRFAALIRDLQILRDSLNIGITGKNQEKAEGRLNDVLSFFKRIQKQQSGLIGKEVLGEISSAVNKLEEEFPTKLCLNSAQNHLNKAGKVKTEEGKAKYVKLARKTLIDGINSGKCRKPELETALKKLSS